MQTDDDRRAHTERVVDALLDSLRRQDMRAFADHWAPDGVMEFPFAPPGYPELRSRDGVWEYVKDYTATLRIDEITEHRRHHTLDPDTVILEFSAKGLAVQQNKPYEMGYVAVITVGPDGVRHYRDYWNSLAAAAAMGGVDAMRAGFAPGTPDA